MWLEGKSRSFLCWYVSPSQMRTVPSRDPDAIRAPSGDQAHALTTSVCPSSSATFRALFLLSMSHTVTVFPPEDTNRRLSGDNARMPTREPPRSWATHSQRTVLLSMSQMIMVPSREAVMTCALSGEKTMDSTWNSWPTGSGENTFAAREHRFSPL